MESYETKILEVRKISENAVTIVVKKPEGFSFIAGQHVMLSLPGEIFKPFSFSNSPTDKNLEITIKSVGVQTSKYQTVKPGIILGLKGPLRSPLEFDESVDKDVVMLSGGSGICPFMSMLKYAVNKNLKNKFIVINSNRTKDDIIYQDELSELSTKLNLEVIYTLTRNKDDSWKGETGRIDFDMIKKYVKDLNNKIFYVCSIPQMVIHLKKTLLDNGIPKENIQ